MINPPPRYTMDELFGRAMTADPPPVEPVHVMTRKQYKRIKEQT